MRFYVNAYGHDGKPILGMMNGQTVLRCTRPERTAHVRRLRTLKNDRVAYWTVTVAIGHSDGREVLRIPAVRQ